MNVKDHYTLSNSVKIPCIGIGTWQSHGEEAVDALAAAIDTGYRLIDTAAAYCTEPVVAKAIEKKAAFHAVRSSSPANCATLRTATRPHSRLLRVRLNNWERTISIFTSFIGRTRSSTVLIGSRQHAKHGVPFEELYRQGRIRAIGVSNFLPHHMDMLMETATIQPMVDQLRLCPGVTQPEIVSYCKAHGIAIEAYSPFGTGSVFHSENIQEPQPEVWQNARPDLPALEHSDGIYSASQIRNARADLGESGYI